MQTNDKIMNRQQTLMTKSKAQGFKPTGKEDDIIQVKKTKHVLTFDKTDFKINHP